METKTDTRAPKEFRSRKRLWSYGLLLALILATLPSSGLAPRPDDLHVLELIQKFTAARSHFDVGSTASMLGKDYVEVSAGGEVIYGKGLLGSLAAHSAPVRRNENAEWTVRYSGDTAIVVSKLSFDSDAGEGGTQHSEQRVIYVLQKLGSDWKILSSQFTPIPAPKS